MNRNEKTETSKNKTLEGRVIISMGLVVVALLVLFTGLLPVRLEIDSMRLAKQLDNIGLSTLSGYFTEGKVAAKPNRDVNVAEYKGSQTALNADNQVGDIMAERQETVTLVIPPKQQLRYRLAMDRDYDLEYSWKTDGKPVYAEFRGEHKDANSKLFAKTAGNKGHGYFIVPFTGHFGWHWDNKTDQPITVRLTTRGAYKVLGPVGRSAAD